MAKPIPMAAPVAEVITRVNRLNVFPDSVEPVFVDGTDFNHLSPSLFGTPAAAADCSTASGASEPVASFMVAWALSNGTLGTTLPVLPVLCSRTPESYEASTLGQRPKPNMKRNGIAPFAHGLFK